MIYAFLRPFISLQIDTKGFLVDLFTHFASDLVNAVTLRWHASIHPQTCAHVSGFGAIVVQEAEE